MPLVAFIAAAHLVFGAAPERPLAAPGATGGGWDSGFATTALDGLANALLAVGGKLYVGGEFSHASGMAAGGVAVWDPGSGAWQGLGSGKPHGPAITLATVQGEIYAGGLYRAGVARWHGGRWDLLADGLQGVGVINSLLGTDSGVFVAGNFITPKGDASDLAFLRAGAPAPAWDDLGCASIAPIGTSDYVWALATEGSSLFVGGRFLPTAALATSAVARLDLETRKWSALGRGLGGTADEPAQVFALALDDGYLYVGGRFVIARNAAAGDDVAVANVARWNMKTQRWEALGPPGAPGVNRWVRALTIHRGRLFVGGWFGKAGGVLASSAARYDPVSRTWSPLGTGLEVGPNVPGDVQASVVLGEDVYFAGTFTFAGGAPVSHVARWRDP
jgi:hypothetical protein